MIGIQHLLGFADVLQLIFGRLVPRKLHDPVEVVAHDRGRFRGHRAASSRAQLLDLGRGLLAGFFRELGLRHRRLFDLVPEFLDLVAAFARPSPSSFWIAFSCSFR
ncbi:MAG: hypothetical protein MPW15_10975 [Candidatus Manganitrophus sp.]|nr:hypothetical protein [Candidatus Manganitrophus sp.]